MANKPTRPTSQQTTLKADAPASPSGAKPTLLWLWVGIAAVIVLAGGFAILSSCDDEELTVGSTVPAATADGSSATTATRSGAAGGAWPEVWPVPLGGRTVVGRADRM